MLRGASGIQWSKRDLEAAGADGILLNPTNTNSLAGFVFEELQLTKKLRFQAAGRIESDDVKGTASIFPPSFLPPPDEPDPGGSQAHVRAEERQRRHPLRSAARRGRCA